MFPASSSSTAAAEPQHFTLSFKLIHEDGAKSLFYAEHDFTDDAKLIFNALQYDTLFINHTCKLVLREHEGAFDIVIQGFDLGLDSTENEATLKFLRHAIENKLSRLGLYNHFYIAADKISPQPLTKTSVIIRHNAQNLKLVPNRGKYQQELDALGFPAESVPDDFCCNISYLVMDIPARDPLYD